MAQWLPAIRTVQIILCITVIIFILLQVRGAGLGSAFGGSSAGSVFKTRRGVERLIFNMTIAFVVLFALVSLITLRSVVFAFFLQVVALLLLITLLLAQVLAR